MKQQHAGPRRIAGTCCSHIVIPRGPKRQSLHQTPTCSAAQTAAGAARRLLQLGSIQQPDPALGPAAAAAAAQGTRVGHASPAPLRGPPGSTRGGGEPSSRGRWRDAESMLVMQNMSGEACGKRRGNKSALEVLAGELAGQRVLQMNTFWIGCCAPGGL